jgi:hypothetical protein
MDLEQPPLSVTEEASLDHALPIPVSLTESGNVWMKGDVPHWPSGPASLTMSSANHGLMGAHALPNPGLSTESDHEVIDVDVPQSIPASLKKHDLQPIDAESPSGKWIKNE